MNKSYETGIPSWLENQPDSSIELPIKTRLQELPFDKLTWENFERLCLRLAQREAEVEGHCQQYGERGDEQEGIDLYARKHLAKKYTVYQCKRVKDFGAAKIEDAVDKFLEGNWIDKTETFVLCTSESLVLKQRADEVIKQRERLLEQEIELIIWDRQQLSLKLKEIPNLVSDFFGDPWIDPFCGRGKAKSLEVQSNQESINERYSNWLTKITSYFLVPGLGKQLSIETAWILLQAKIQKSESQESPQTIEKQLAQYHESSKHQNRNGEDKDPIIDVDNIDEFPNKAVLIGRAGAGKSTILRRLAYLLARSNKKIILVRLSKVAQYFDSGETFDNSILMEAVDGSGIDLQSLKIILSTPEYLLADGLDECGSQQASIAQELVKWSQGHSQTKIILTSRPFGYDSAYLPQWKRLDILSLKDTHGNAQKLLEALFDDEVKVEEELNKFQAQIEVNKTASIVIQNPLLLGFLLQLSIKGVKLVQRRTGVYKSIINLAYQQSLPNRDLKKDFDEIVAYRVLEIIGWHLQNSQNTTKQDLIKAIGKELADELDRKPLLAQKEANEGISFWEERRILELFKIGNQEFVTFAHLSLQEYSAGCYAATLDSQNLCEWLQKVRRKPKFRETILFAAGSGVAKEICEYLLELDNFQDPTSIEAQLSAEALTETEQQFTNLVELVVPQLQLRLESDIPYLVFEAAEKLLNLVPQASNLIGSVASSLSENDNFWIRLAGIRLALECGDDYINLNILTEILNSFSTQPLEHDFSSSIIMFSTLPKTDREKRYGDMGYEFQEQIILKGAQLLLDQKSDNVTKKCIEKLQSQDRLSYKTSMELTEIIHDYKKKKIAQNNYGSVINDSLIVKQYFEAFQDIVRKAPRDFEWKINKKKKHERASRVFLEIIIKITKNSSYSLSHQSSSYQEAPLSRLYFGMGWWEQITSAWDILGDQEDLEAVETVIKGAIIAIKIDPQRLAKEASTALKTILESIKKLESIEYDLKTIEGLIKVSSMDLSRSWNIFGSSSPKSSFTPSWELAKNAKLSPENLVRALKHRSDGIRRNATLLLMHGAGGNEAPKLVKTMLQEENDEMTLWAISNVAPNICGEETIKMFLERLNQPLTKGCIFLLKRLPEICRYYNVEDYKYKEVFSSLLNALKTNNPIIATAAGEALSKFEVSQVSGLGSQIRETFDYWIKTGTWCERHQIKTYSSSCPECRTVLARPQSKLVSILTKLELISTEELINLCADSKSGVYEETLESLVEQASEDKTILISLLKKINAQELSEHILIKLLSLSPNILIDVKIELIQLCNSNSAIIREIMINNLSNSDWLDKQEAIDIFENALKDDDIPVRNQAVMSLRNLKNI